jgi:stage III sporulation protein AA
MPYIEKNNIQNTLIISPPQCGKTTIIRDAAQQLGSRFKVSVIDERGEIAAMHKGMPQYDIGDMTDVLDLCPKAIGIPLMLRSMSPDVIITDEIAGCDVEAIKQALSCGVRIIATAHGDNVWQVKKRLGGGSIMEEFGCIILLGRRNGPGTIERIEEIGIKTGSKSGQSLII